MTSQFDDNSQYGNESDGDYPSSQEPMYGSYGSYGRCDQIPCPGQEFGCTQFIPDHAQGCEKYGCPYMPTPKWQLDQLAFLEEERIQRQKVLQTLPLRDWDKYELEREVSRLRKEVLKLRSIRDEVAELKRLRAKVAESAETERRLRAKVVELESNRDV